MAEYNITFAEKLADTATMVVADGVDTSDAARTVLYLSLLASEIALKALLEKAGAPVSQIKRRSHNLRELLEDLCRCRIRVQLTPGHPISCSASRLLAVTVDAEHSNATVGTILEAEDVGASKYPNQIRYGDLLKHYPPQIVLKVALAVISWAKANWDTISVAKMVSRNELLKRRCSSVFAKKAMELSPLFYNDYDVFIALVEEMLQVPRTASQADLDDLEPPRIRTPSASLDHGNLEVEFDYNGDYLTSCGRR